MAEATHVFVHVRQRLDALTYDGHSQYLLSSLPVVSPFQPPVVQTSRRRVTVCGSLLWYAGLTTFYFRLVVLLGTGWLLAMVESITFLYARPAAQEDIAITSPNEAILLFGVSFFGGGLGCLVSGISADYFGRRPVLLSLQCFWIIINALTAGAWNYASLVTLRLLAGVGIGGQMPLLAILALEFSPTRTRGIVIILSVSFAGLGIFLGVGYGQLMNTEKELGWRLMHFVLSAIALVILIIFYMTVDESPKFLASVGRSDEAFSVLNKIEMVHGITRSVRVTVPTSLYEPPSQQPQSNYEWYVESFDSNSNIEMDMQRHDGDDDGIRSSSSKPVPGMEVTKACTQSQRSSTSRLQNQSQSYECTHRLDNRGIPLYNFAFVTNTSFRSALSHRLVVLFSHSMARRTTMIWFFWFAESTCCSGAILTTLAMAKTFQQVKNSDPDLTLFDQLLWAFLLFPGILLNTAIIERLGRRVTLGLFLFCSGIIMVISAWILHEDSKWTEFILAFGVMIVSIGGSIGALIVLTSEQFPLVTRALGISTAAAWCHFGTFLGVYLVFRRYLDDTHWTWQQKRWTLAVYGALVLVLLPLILLMGPEKHGRDIDALFVQDPQENCANSNRESSSQLSASSSGPTNTRHCVLSKRIDNALKSSEKEDSLRKHVKFSNMKQCESETQENSCESSLSSDEISEHDAIGAGHDRHQNLRLNLHENQSLRPSILENLEPILIDWRHSLSSSCSDSKIVDSDSNVPCTNDAHLSAAERFSINLEMFDTFTFISTPVLGGDNCTHHEHRKESNSHKL
ncbi:Predicted transporter (major facilitator superfamily) [Plasmopara halstedii]|uniref:Predicted transporter (Major facilitator superfamily) n=1 Tax=Plasmopara halstedii TaxID=4781 RepID=A0A0N7L521_PLAHL|nr:Predicted transporter (major facilitator superfamily) [Plasmopara halstedii]CEG40259.1 Predicted transporter (major facilitator superfamily) [Plasmopara halstedii]|eukprot:XP_024576628.1 Predicted transporter (major facilitator superfamily) [Plasmopara halstedii]